MTISIDKLNAVTHVITHANCSDGLASAMIIKDALPHVEVTFLQYNSEDHVALAAAPGMLFCDFAPHPSKVADFVAAGAIVLDHHKTALSLVTQFGANGVYADETANPGVSGAVLAFSEVWDTLYNNSPALAALTFSQKADLASQIAALQTSGTLTDASVLTVGSVAFTPSTTPAEGQVTIPSTLLTLSAKYKRLQHFATVAGIRDTWQKTSPLWDEANCQSAALMFYPQDSWLNVPSIFYDNTPGQWGFRLQIGGLILQKNLASSQRALDGAYKFTSNGIRVSMFPGTGLTSDAADMVRNSVDLVIGFGFAIDSDADMTAWTDTNSTAVGPKLIASCRSNENFDASAFAASLGGGGHTRAAGFSKNLKATDVNPYAYLKTLVDAFTAPKS